jgi:hypothetical protein
VPRSALYSRAIDTFQRREPHRAFLGTNAEEIADGIRIIPLSPRIGVVYGLSHDWNKHSEDDEVLSPPDMLIEKSENIGFLPGVVS